MTTEADLGSQAREWLVLLNSGRASAADHAAMERWRRTSAEHAKALAEAENLWALLGQVERCHRAGHAQTQAALAAATG